MSKVKVDWLRDRFMVGSDSNGQSIVIGFTNDDDPKRKGVNPLELLLLSLASCTCYDVIEIMEKQRKPLDNLQVVCEGEQNDEWPHIFKKIYVHYFATGNVKPSKLERAIYLSENKYCSVITTLKQSVEIVTDYTILGD